MEIHSAPIISPYCVYHYVNQETDTHWGYIGVSEMLKHDDGSISYICPAKSPELHSIWVLSGIFYAVSPIIRPIPTGMRLFCANRDEAFPYRTTSVSTVYDPFDVQKNCTNFITYTQPVPHTTPLYLHMLGNTVFPSFNKYPPTDDSRWSKESIDPIFVMTPNLLDLQGIKDPSELQFTCVNGRCIPWSPNMDKQYIDSKVIKKKFNDCLLQCDEVTLSNTSEPRGMLDTVQMLSTPKYTIPRLFKKIPSYAVGIFMGLFVLSIITILVITLNKTDSKKK